MNKRGFISTSIIFSFFILFTMILLTTLAVYVSNRQVIGISKNQQKDELKTYLDEDLDRITNSTNLYTNKTASQIAYILNNKIEEDNTYQETNHIYYHNSDLSNGADDESFRYSGADSEVNNFVCFNNTENICPEDNLYRIIGYFKKNNSTNYRIKLIKSTYATAAHLGTTGDYDNNNKYYWNNNSGNNANLWRESLLNKENLNNYYYNEYLTEEFANLIDNNSWIIGGNTQANIIENNARSSYSYELGSNKLKTGDSGCISTSLQSVTCSNSDLTYTSKIGLMYVTDYYFAAETSYWTYPGYNGSGNDYRLTEGHNWLNKINTEWTITRAAGYGPDIYCATKYVGRYNSNSSQYLRPVFYLKTNVTFRSGNGTSTNPFRINMGD